MPWEPFGITRRQGFVLLRRAGESSTGPSDVRIDLRLRFLLVLLPVTLGTTLGMGLLARSVLFRSYERETLASERARVLSHALPLTSRLHTLDRKLAVLVEHADDEVEATGGEAFVRTATEGHWLHDARGILEQWLEVREIFCVHSAPDGTWLTRIGRNRVDSQLVAPESLPVWARWSSNDVAACIVPGRSDLHRRVAFDRESDGTPVLWMDRPFADGTGTLGLVLRPEALVPFLTSHPEEEASGHDEGRMVLVDSRGRIVPTSADDLSVRTPDVSTLAEYTAARSAVTTVLEYRPPSEKTLVASLHADPELGLAVVRVVPRDALVAELTRVDRAMGLLTLVALLATTATILALTRRVAVPLQRLTRTMAEVSRGDLSQRLPVDGPGEIAQLARTFNTMISDLHTTHVALRTQSSRLAEALHEIEDVEAMKDSFLALVSHEVRTPLTSIMGGVEFLREEFGQQHDDTQTEFMQIIYDSARRLAGFMNDAIMMASLQANRSRSGFEYFSLTALLHGKFDEIAAAAQAAGIEIENRMDQQREFFVLGDWTLMQVALEKVLQNAVRHNVSGGRVVVEVVERVLEDADGDVARLMAARGIDTPETQMRWRAVRVFNTGPIVPEDKIEGLFARFELTHDISNHQRGSGLSLPIAHYVLNFHGGCIEVRAVGTEGMAFYLVLPGRLSLQARNATVDTAIGVDETVSTARLVESAAQEVERLERTLDLSERGSSDRRERSGSTRPVAPVEVVAPVPGVSADSGRIHAVPLTRMPRGRLEEVLVGHDPRVDGAQDESPRE